MNARQTLKASVILAPLFALIVGVICLQGSEPTLIESRAARVFEFDSKFRDKLPAGQVRSLSMALAFHNETGAKRLLDKLEPLIKN